MDVIWTEELVVVWYGTTGTPGKNDKGVEDVVETGCVEEYILEGD